MVVCEGLNGGLDGLSEGSRLEVNASASQRQQQTFHGIRTRTSDGVFAWVVVTPELVKEIAFKFAVAR